LQAIIWTNNINYALKVTKGVKAGNVAVNKFGPPSPNEPFGGFKSSGIGRENGLEGFLSYMQTKTLSIAIN